MRIPALPDDRLEVCTKRVSGGISLRTWLADRWAILFSHPEDFAQEQLEMDRWICIVSHSFSAHDIAPLALLRAGYDAKVGWLARLAALSHDRAALLSLESREPDTVSDLAASPLRADIARSGPRFAMIIDSNLRSRRTLSYRLPGELPSPLDLLGWAAGLRKRDRDGEERRREAPESSLPFRSGWARATRYAVAHAGRG